MIVPVGGEKQTLEQVLCCLFGGRLADRIIRYISTWAFQLRAGRIDPQGTGDIRTMIQIVGEQRVNLFDATIHQTQQLLGNFVVGVGQQLSVSLSMWDDTPSVEKIKRNMTPASCNIRMALSALRPDSTMTFYPI